MATQAFKDWAAAGRPFKLAQPVDEYRHELLLAGWPKSLLGTIGDEAHLQAEHPEDHCPFSVTGWPQPNEYPYVCALDVGAAFINGLDVDQLVTYWLAEARAGHTPWIKYINWQGYQYDVRRSWVRTAIGGHYDHAHISFRTDWTLNGIGEFAVIPKGPITVTTQTGRDVWNEPITSDAEHFAGPAREWLKYIHTASATADRIEALVKALSDSLQPRSDVPGSDVTAAAIADALAASGGFIDQVAAAIVVKLGPIATLDQVVELLKDLTIETKIR